MTAPRWEECSEEARARLVGYLRHLSDNAGREATWRRALVDDPGGHLAVAATLHEGTRATIDAAIARLAGRSAEEEPSCRFCGVFFSCEIAGCDNCATERAHAAPLSPAPAPTAAERWRAVPAEKRRDLAEALEDVLVPPRLLSTLRALLELAEEAGGGR